MKLMLFGKDGQVGQALQPAMARLGEVVAFGRAEADFERPGELPRLVAEHAPDIIVNAAAYTAVDRAETESDRARLVNTEAVAALAGAASRLGAWLIHYSTDYVYDGRKDGAYVETDEAAPLSVYGATKHKGDLAVKASGCRHLILRVSWVYAAGHANFGRSMLRLARDRAELNVVADQVGAPTSAGFIAAATAAAIPRLSAEAEALSGIYHLAAAGAVTRCDYARFLIGEARDRGAKLTLDPANIRPVATTDYPLPAARPLNSRLSTEKLVAAFGIRAPAWEDDARAWVAAAIEGGEI